MRLSADESSPYWSEIAVYDDTRVLVNGEPRIDVVEACEEEGWADVLRTDAGGKLALKGDRPALARLRGIVQILPGTPNSLPAVEDRR